MELSVRPALPLTQLQRVILWLSGIVVAITRVPAISRTVWDWDEALFCIGVRDYDVVYHAPHPPGFPLYVAAAKFVHLFVPDEFRALQVIVVASSIALFPLLVWLGREAGLTFTTAWLGALLMMFLPNVWMYGGTAFSDVPGLAVLIAACALLLRGCRDVRAYIAGAVLLGAAAAIRPQAIIVGAVPALLSSWFRVRVSWKPVALAAVLGASVIVISYAGAALASESVHGYLLTLQTLREYVRHVDSYMNPARPPLRALLPSFFVYAIPGPQLLVAALSAAAGAGLISGIVRRSRGPLLIAGMFLPFNIFGWLMLDTHSISRYAVSFAPMYTLLAVEAVATLALVLRRFASVGTAVIALATTALFAVWMWPTLETLHRSVSPPVQAMRWIAANVPRDGTVFVHGSMLPYARYLAPPQHAEPWEEQEGRAAPFGPHDVVVIEEPSAAVSAHNFVRGRDRLFSIARQRYFEVSVGPATSRLTFGDGWYDAEGWGPAAWRWMGHRSVTMLPAVAGNARLTIIGDLPTELVPRHPTLEVRLNGQLLDRSVCSQLTVKKSWIVPARANGPNELVLSLDKVINPAKEGINPDGRDLGLQLNHYGWEAVGE